MASRLLVAARSFASAAFCTSQNLQINVLRTFRFCISPLISSRALIAPQTGSQSGTGTLPLLNYSPSQSYKVKVSLRRRCNGCYFVKRQGRMFIECKEKPRHKQMQKISKRTLYDIIKLNKRE